MSGENTPMSKKGKFSVQNWQSDPMNSPKAFGELKNFMTHFMDGPSVKDRLIQPIPNELTRDFQWILMPTYYVHKLAKKVFEWKILI